MSKLSGVRQWLAPRIAWLAPLAILVVLSISDFVFFASSIAPSLQMRAELVSQVEQTQNDSGLTTDPSGDNPANLSRSLASARTTLTAMLSSLPANSQPGEVINALYQAARVSGVTITRLEAVLPTPGAPAASPTATTRATVNLPTATPVPSTPGPGTPTAQAATPVLLTPVVRLLPTTAAGQPAFASPTPTGFYSMTILRLQAQGEARRLFNFVARFRDLQLGSFGISAVNMTGDARTATLFLDLTSYSSLPTQPKATPVK